MLLLSIATVEHWLAVDGVGSLSTIFTLCAFVFACECAVCLPVSVSCLFADEAFQDVVCLVDSITVETQN